MPSVTWDFELTEKYSFHLTDQYYISHASFNCTNISQKLRLQGKYNDDKPIVLTLWITR